MRNLFVIIGLLVSANFAQAQGPAQNLPILIESQSQILAQGLNFQCSHRADFNGGHYVLSIGLKGSTALDTELVAIERDSSFSSSQLGKFNLSDCQALVAKLKTEDAANGGISAVRAEQVRVTMSPLGDLCLIQGGQTLSLDLESTSSTNPFSLSVTNSNFYHSSADDRREKFVEAACNSAIVNQYAQELADELLK